MKLNTGEKNTKEMLLDKKPPIYHRCKIPKSKGGYRYIYMTDDVDEKVAQQYVNIVLAKYYERHFHDRSYAYRPKRSAHDAIKKMRNDIDNGYIYLVKLDVEKCFDNIPHQKLIEILRSASIDPAAIEFSIQCLRRLYQLSDGSVCRFREKGFMQGMILAPLLCNVYLNRLDWWVQNNLSDIRFVRYADDILLMGKCRMAVTQARYQIRTYIKESMKLNMPSAPVINPNESILVFLGFDLSKRKPITSNSDIGFEPALNAIERVIEWLEGISQEGGDIPCDVACHLQRKLGGWRNYYQVDPNDLLDSLPSWLRPVALDVMGERC